MQLVDLLDRVLDMLDREPGFAFTLDGQLATVDDFLEVRPEAEKRIRRFAREGRLAIGPWLILPDEFLVSGETLVRNLEAGWSRAEDFGGSMRVGYLPDMFGHIAQMPQLLQRAGVTDAVVWRGVPAKIDHHAFHWTAPDGSTVRAEYLADGYGNAAYLFAAPDRFERAVDRFLEASRPWFGDDAVLAMYGTDHTAPLPELAALVGRLNEIHDAPRIRIGTLAEYIASAPPLAHDGPRWNGELRAGARANVLMGVTSARMDIKQAAARAERLLERYAEPFSALCLPAAAWPEALLRLAWRRVIENSAHDSICGCSVDAVADQVRVRFAEAEQIAGALTRRAAATTAARVPLDALAALNPSPVPRVAVIEHELPVPAEWEHVTLELPDGSRVATQEVSRKEPLLLEGELRGADVDDLFRRFHGREIFDHAWNGYRFETDADGARVLVIEVDETPEPAWLDIGELRAEITQVLRTKPEDTWRLRVVARPRRRLLAALPLPALGWTAARPVAGGEDATTGVRVDTDGRGLRNGLLAVTVADDGTLGLETADGTTVGGVGRIVDGGDFGDSYNYGPPAVDRMVDAPDAVSVELVEGGPLRGRLVVTRGYAWPVGLEPDGAARSEATMATEVRTLVELRTGEVFARIMVSFDNRADDHRIRFHIPLPRPADRSHAEGQFAVVARGMTAEGGYRETPLPTFPAATFVDAGGIAALLDHVTEYELLEAATPSGRELALALLRGTGLISRNANPYRMDPAGPQIPVPGAQLRGVWRIGFALMPHAGAWHEAGVAAAAEAYRLAPITAAGSADRSAWPPAGAGAGSLQLHGENVSLTSLRRRSDGWVEVRVVNLAASPVDARLTGAVTEAREADLLGRPGHALSITDGSLRMRLGAAEIRTLHLRLPDPQPVDPALVDLAEPRLNV